jgi:hypothetical protein
VKNIFKTPHRNYFNFVAMKLFVILSFYFLSVMATRVGDGPIAGGISNVDDREKEEIVKKFKENLHLLKETEKLK